MPRRRYALARFLAGAVIAALLVAFATIQLASDALAASVAAPRTLPRSIPVGFGLFVYRVLDAIAPAPYVETSLAQDALARGDADAAERYAARLPASPVRDELLARVAAARGQSALAREYYLAAPDPAAVGASAQSIAIRDPATGYSLEQLLEIRLARDGTHPDAVADAYWQMGRLANRQAWREVPGSPRQRAWLETGLRDFDTAALLAPLSQRYAVEAANQADLLGDRRRAQSLFSHAADIDPRSADAIAGLGVIAWENGDRQAASAYLTRARALDPRAPMVRALERDLR
ncbi:MAG: tetratricopeptide repeat protein [Candidatus Cybelea sp.]